MLIQQSVKDFVHTVDSNEPAPGGGSVSALAGALGIALARMVGHLTIPKKKFRNLDPQVQAQFQTVFAEFESFEEMFLALIQEDTLAFQEMMASYQLPKETETESLIRLEAIEQATIQGIEVPLRVMKLAYRAMHKMDLFLRYGNRTALSDVGVAVLMIVSAIEGAALNVKINLPGLKDQTTAFHYHKEIAELLEKAKKKAALMMDEVHLQLG